MSSNNTNNEVDVPTCGKLELIKRREADLSKLLADVRLEKLQLLRDRPLKIGVMGFGRFGQFIAKSFLKHAEIVGTSMTDYTDVAKEMGAKFIPLSDPEAFLDEELDVIVLAVSILSLDDAVKNLAKHLEKYLNGQKGNGKCVAPLVVDVCSVKEHPRKLLLEYLPEECDILCTHPMFGPDSGKDGWKGLTFVYERTRLGGIVLDADNQTGHRFRNQSEFFFDGSGQKHTIHGDNEGFTEAVERIERFLSIWEEEGCNMIPMSCKQHDNYSSRSQFITHLMGRILAKQGLTATPIDTKGFQSVLQLIKSTSADSFDLFYGLYKHNQNSPGTIEDLQNALEDVVSQLKTLEIEDKANTPKWVKRTSCFINPNNIVSDAEEIEKKVLAMELKLDETDPSGVPKTKV